LKTTLLDLAPVQKISLRANLLIIRSLPTQAREKGSMVKGGLPQEKSGWAAYIPEPPYLSQSRLAIPSGLFPAQACIPLPFLLRLCSPPATG